MSQNNTGCCVGKHDCLSSISESWCNQGKLSTYTQCMSCRKITGFHYKSFWVRLRALFNFNPTKPIKIAERSTHEK